MDRTHLSRKRRYRSLRAPFVLGGVSIAIVAVLGWWMSGSEPSEPGAAEIAGARHADAGDQTARQVRPARPDDPIERGAQPAVVPAATPAERASRIEAAAKAAQRALDKDDILTAQVQMSAALRAGATGEQATELRAKLVQLANKVVLSPARIPGDPRTATYLVKRGDNLQKIAKAFDVTAELIAKINNLRNMSMIREGARLKVTRGPFSLLVYKGQHVADAYLGDVLVRTYRVGLGKHASTPTGTWRVKNKLTNPTYFPPRGGKIVQADDPNNPLGEHWLGLEGVSGEAKSQVRYGIHGTNEPESIGKDLSLGCIRLHNEDVAELYTLLVVGKSQVTIQE